MKGLNSKQEIAACAGVAGLIVLAILVCFEIGPLFCA